MQSYFGPLLIIGIAGLMSALIYAGVFERKNIKYIFHVFSFFAVCYGFIMSLVKLRLGYVKENLFESFWDIQGRTYIHYFIPMIVIAIFMPFVVRFVFKACGIKFIRIFDSCCCFVYFFSYLYALKISNKVYCITFIISSLFALITYFYRKKDDVEFALEAGYRASVSKLLPILLYWIVTVVIYSPNELYLSNIEDFPMAYGFFFGRLLLVGVVMLVVSSIVFVLYLTSTQVRALNVALFSLLTMGYIQGMLLNGSMRDLDGDGQTWGTVQIVVNLIIWIVIIAAFVMFCILKKSLAERVIRIVSIWLVLIQVVSLGTLIITTDNVEDKSGWELTTEGMLDISQNGNILVFVLDKFDGRIMDEILEDNPDFLEPLNDFTYYTNATSEFYPTAFSIPYLLSGTEYDEENSSYTAYACQGDDVLIKRLYEKGYDIGVYTSTSTATKSIKDIISNSKEGVERTCNTMDLASLMIQTSKYKMAPFISKDYFIYDTTDVTQLTATDNLTNIDNDLPFYKRLTSKGLSINERLTGGTFKFYHMHGAHSPYIMTDEFQSVDYDARRDDSWGDNLSQARGAMKIVYEYINQLKQLDKYDDATIIITADHGAAGTVVKDNGEQIQQSLPIMFVKMPYTASDEIVISEAPVAQEDLISTILNVSGVDTEAKVITDYKEGDDRVRVSRVRTGSMDIKYEINGNVRDVESWSTIYSKQ